MPPTLSGTCCFGTKAAVYSALPAGSYRFRVAATGGGDWTGTEAVWRFVIRPPFYQTAWFYGRAVVGVALCFWGCWRLRLLAIHRSFRLV